MNNQKDESGFSLIELLIVVTVIGIIAAIALPNYMASRRSANEATTIASTRTIVTAQSMYGSSMGSGKYAPTLAQMVSVNLIDDAIGSGARAGYQYQLTVDNTQDPAVFVISAIPALTSGYFQTGSRRIGSDETGVLRADATPANLGTHFTVATIQSAQPIDK